jgi:hypothetical protein
MGDVTTGGPRRCGLGVDDKRAEILQPGQQQVLKVFILVCHTHKSRRLGARRQLSSKILVYPQRRHRVSVIRADRISVAVCGGGGDRAAKCSLRTLFLQVVMQFSGFVTWARRVDRPG